MFGFPPETIITSILALIAITLSAISFFSSHKLAIRQSKSSTYSEIMSRLFELNSLEIEKPKLFKTLYKKEFDPKLVAKGGDEGLGHYLFMLFNLYEEIFIQKDRFDLLDDVQFEQWTARIENDFNQKPFLQGYWKFAKNESPGIFSADFREFVDKRFGATA